MMREKADRAKIQPQKQTNNQSITLSGHLLPKVISAADVTELVIVRAGVGLRVWRFGSEKPVTRPLLGLLSLTVPKSNQGIELLPLLHFLLRGQRTR